MTWGPRKDYLERVQEDMGFTPPALLARPEQHELGGDLYEAFNTLSSSRQYGMNGPLPVSIGEMMLWCWGMGIDNVDERAAFIRTMQKLDKTYLAEVARQSDTATKSEVVEVKHSP